MGFTFPIGRKKAVAEPSPAGRAIATWPSFALIAAYELLVRQVRYGSAGTGRLGRSPNPGPGRAGVSGPAGILDGGRGGGR